jgi:hypothetical protein
MKKALNIKRCNLNTLMNHIQEYTQILKKAVDIGKLLSSQLNVPPICELVTRSVAQTGR